MADLVRWDPFREMVSLREAMDRLFEESFVRPFGPLFRAEGVSTLAIDMYETDNDVVVKASVPGVKAKDLDITVTGNMLTIKGEVKEESEGKKGDYHYRERRYGAFQRSVTLPVDVQADKAEATFEDGVLTLRLPKVEEAKPKQITIKAK
ncbi:MAG: Hsp20/alpha crystallin family protein [Chloroflexi bacterium]|jgi:HSP20 family protein|nr:Hsp20/alpha crystallin family protein [Chloroflexota bacterium]